MSQPHWSPFLLGLRPRALEIMVLERQGQLDSKPCDRKWPVGQVRVPSLRDESLG